MQRLVYLLNALLVSATVLGNSAQPVQSEQAPDRMTVEFHAEVQERVDALTRSIFERDLSTFSELLSNEVHQRSIERGVELHKLLEKQRAAITRTFALAEGETPEFEVAGIAGGCDAMRVTLNFRGETIVKAFYFVREDGILRFNLAPPGFSKTPPNGVLFGKDKYLVKNLRTGGFNAPVSVSCYQGPANAPWASILVPSQTSKTITCEEACGWWSGSAFSSSAGAPLQGPKYCDWNSWGVDVYITATGWTCNDYC
jgi:hypothetical protein